jgi:F-type H+-transporting ATPase subunit delta
MHSGSTLTVQDAMAQLRAFEDVLRESRELYEVLTTPALPMGRKKAVMGRIFARLQLSRTVSNFFFVLLDRRRLPLLEQIIVAFEGVVDERMGFVRAEVQSALPLPDPQRASLLAQLERLTGKRIRPHYAIRESLIGGVLVRIGSTVYDGSVRGQLEALERRLGAEA